MKKRRRNKNGKRGAPFKGETSDVKEEKNVKVRRSLLRRFKTFYEERQFLPSHLIGKPGRPPKTVEQLKREKEAISNDDITWLF